MDARELPVIHGSILAIGYTLEGLLTAKHAPQEALDVSQPDLYRVGDPLFHVSA